MDTRSFERGRGEYMGITMNVIMIGNQYLSIVKSYKKKSCKKAILRLILLIESYFTFLGRFSLVIWLWKGSDMIHPIPFYHCTPIWLPRTPDHACTLITSSPNPFPPLFTLHPSPLILPLNPPLSIFHPFPMLIHPSPLILPLSPKV